MAASFSNERSADYSARERDAAGLHHVFRYASALVIWLNLLFSVSSDCAVSLSFTQGEEGDQGSPGEVGSQGPMVRCCYLLDGISHSLLSAALFFSLLTEAPVGSVCDCRVLREYAEPRE